MPELRPHRCGFDWGPVSVRRVTVGPHGEMYLTVSTGESVVELRVSEKGFKIRATGGPGVEFRQRGGDNA